MAAFAGIALVEVYTGGTARSSVTTDPTIRLLASGGEHYLAGPIVRQTTTEILCDDATLAALRVALSDGVIDDLQLDDETMTGVELTAIGDPVSLAGCDLWHVTLTFVATAQVITPRIGVNAAGVALSGILGVSTSVGRITRMATATVRLTHAQGQRGDPCEIYGSAGGAAVALFKGTIENISTAFYPGEAVVLCVGTLSRLARPWPTIEDYTLQTDDAMITNFVEKWDGLHSIEGSGWLLGQKRPVQPQPGDTFLQWVDEIDTAVRRRTYDRHDGAVSRRRDSPREVGAVTHTLSEGSSILSIQVTSDEGAVRNHIIVEGITIDGQTISSATSATSAAIDATMPGTAPNYVSYTIKSDLIEDSETANGIADINLFDLTTVPMRMEVTVPFDPTLVVDDTVHISVPSIGLDAAAMIYDVKHEVAGDGGTTTITTNRGTL